VKYTREFYPEHPRTIDYDSTIGGRSSYAANLYNIAYGKAMLQAALIMERG
jgi:hypothetical protein